MGSITEIANMMDPNQKEPVELSEEEKAAALEHSRKLQEEALKEREEKEKARNEKLAKTRKYGIAISAIVAIGLIGVGIYLTVTQNVEEDPSQLGWVLILVGVIFGVWRVLEYTVFTRNNPDKTRHFSEDAIVITSDIVNYKGKKYTDIVVKLQELGFSRIDVSPVDDLTQMSRKKNGTVRSITFDGERYILVGDKFSKDAKVNITYYWFNR